MDIIGEARSHGGRQLVVKHASGATSTEVAPPGDVTAERVVPAPVHSILWVIAEGDRARTEPQHDLVEHRGVHPEREVMGGDRRVGTREEQHRIGV